VQLCAEYFLNFGLKLTTYFKKPLANRELSVMQLVAVRLLVGRNILSLQVINQIWHPKSLAVSKINNKPEEKKILGL
jgi:hypothetical protein